MSQLSGILDLASGVGGGQIHKQEVLSAVDEYERYHDDREGADNEEKKANYYDMVNKFYDLATSFCEYDIGESLHSAPPRWKGESYQESIKRYEHFVALQLGLRPGQRVLDVGCGIGGPMREIARFSDTFVTGININEYQIRRGKDLSRLAGVDKNCTFVKADFMNMPFPENSFDAVYALESICHAPDVLDCFKEIYRVLKPGQCFAASEWCLTNSFDHKNKEHRRLKSELELGNGLPDIRSMGQYIEALRLAGFEVVWDKDVAGDSPPPLGTKMISLRNSRLTNFFSTIMVQVLEFVGIAPKGSRRIQALLVKGSDALGEARRMGIFTSMYFFLARKP